MRSCCQGRSRACRSRAGSPGSPTTSRGASTPAPLECDETPGRQAIDACGDEGFVFSTDYPHYDTKYPEATARFLKLPIGEASKRRILWDNCARLYRTGPP